MKIKFSALEDRIHKELLLLGYFLSIDEKTAIISKMVENELVALFIIDKDDYFVHIKNATYITIDVIRALYRLLVHYKKMKEKEFLR